MDTAHAHEHPQAGPTLSKAVIRAAGTLEIAKGTLAAILGVSAATITRLFAGTYILDPSDRKTWEHSALFVRLYRSLDSLLGHDTQAKTWLQGRNTALNARPIDLITTSEGLVRVVTYLDCYRGRV